MRKETFIAIVIGIFVGLLLGFGVWRANSALTNRNNSTENTSSNKLQKGSAQNELPKDGAFINLVLPKNLSVTSREEVTITGVTSQNAIIVISTETEDHTLRADEDGAFEKEIKLSGGLNQILVSAFDQNGDEAKEKVMIVYSTEFVEEDAVSDDTGKSLEERLKDAQSNARVFLGSITDKTDISLQIKNPDGEIQIVAIDENSGFAQSGVITKSIKYSDVAIGDYIIAMGYENTKGVLTTQRVLVTNPPVSPTRKIVLGEIISIKNKVINIKDRKDLDWIVTLPARWKGPDIKQIKVGDILVVIGEPEIDKPENIKVRTIGFEPVISQETIVSPSPSPKISPSVTKTKASPTPTVKAN